jgi:hypothetical protein
MRCSLLLLLLCGSLPAQELKLIPMPRSIVRGAGELRLPSAVKVEVTSDSEDDRFAAGLLVSELREIHHMQAAAGPAPGAIVIGRPGNRLIDAEIARRKLDAAALDHDESYLLSVNPASALIVSKSAEGIYYGVQTLRQLVAPGGAIPSVTVADWPALRYRVLSLDISRGPVPTDEQFETIVRTAAEFKMNMLSLYLEHVFPYRHAALAAPEGGAVTPGQMRRLSVYARRHHVDLVPHQQLFGHLHNLLQYELYAPLAEIPHGSVLTPAGEATYDWIRQAVEQLAEAFPSRFLHVGADETWELGEGRSRELARDAGVAGLYLRHVERVAEIVRPLGKRIFMPGDIVLKHPEIIPKLPKDLIVVSWVYAAKDDYSASIEPFRNQGLSFFICTAVHNWNRVFPNITQTRANVNGFSRDAKKLGALGMIASHWGDDGEALFNLTWYGVLFSAAAAWQPGMVDEQQFDDAYDWTFYRNSSDHTFVKANRALAAANDVLKAPGINGATDSLFWVDPYSRHGAEAMAKAYPFAAKMRLLAEQAAVDLAAGKSKAVRHADTVAALQFAARRMDYLGMKIQFAREIADCYHAARADPGNDDNVTHNLRRIRGMDGLMPSLRDYIHEVKRMYRDTWLLENRPYWLDNVLVRYDAEALYWVRQMQVFEGALRQAETTRTLPDPRELGLTMPDPQ